CISGGGQNGTITLTNVEVVNGGGTDQKHNLYFSADADAVDNSCYAMSGVVSRNVYGQDQDHASWTMKLRLCVGSLGPGTIDNSIAGCTTATLINCDQNGAVDFPCGGHHSITNSVLNVGQGAQGGHGSFYMIKYGEEIQFGAGFCPTLSG